MKSDAGTCWSKDQIRDYWDWFPGKYKGESTSRELIKLTRRFIGKRVLDVGAATGELIRLLPGGVGIDLVPKAPEVKQGDIEALAFADGSFDTVFACDIVEHLGDETLEKGMHEIHRVLAPRGTLIIGAPNNEPEYNNLVFCPYCRKGFHRHGHQRRLNVHTSKILLEQHGFHLIKAIETDLTLRQRNYGALRVAILHWMRVYLKDLVVVGRKGEGP